jgi:hypothetical protein
MAVNYYIGDVHKVVVLSKDAGQGKFLSNRNSTEVFSMAID